MAPLNSLAIASASLMLLISVSATVYLSPDQDILLPASSSASNPLSQLGANSPYFAGPNINGVDNTVPDNCYVDQVAYVVRHGSRYPDNGAYQQWVTLYQKIEAAQYTALGDLSFLPSWKPVLTNSALQISMESPTGFKEAFDLGYRLRTKYPKLYTEGTPFISWANLYPRVVQTAQNFVRGFLGNPSTESKLGSIITVNSTGSPLALFDSLSPSDQCPLFVDGNGGTQALAWDAIYLPPITARLNALLAGNLNFTDADVSLFPYLCGFESQITGTLSPWCGAFTDDELAAYAYRQDLRYYYGTGPGMDLPSKMMLPFLNSLVSILSSGPNVTGTAQNGSTFTLPRIITAFLNDGQISELGTATGVFDDQDVLLGTEMDSNRTYQSSHFITMRGTVAFERLTCVVNSSSVTTTTSSTTTSPTPTPTPLVCNADNCYRELIDHRFSSMASLFCLNYTTATLTATSAIPTYLENCKENPSAVSSACSCIMTATTTSSTAVPTVTSSPTTTQTYIRVLLNDAVYPVPGCADGPGSTCLLSSYGSIVAGKLAAAGDLRSRCNVTDAAAPTVLKGAGFFTDLTGDWLATVSP